MDDIILLKRTNKQNNKPTPTQLQYGEIAINYKKDNENIFIKNDNDEIIGFSYKNELQEKVDKIEGKGLSTNDFTNIKCKQAFKDWCIKNQDIIDLPDAMRNGGSGTWEIVD